MRQLRCVVLLGAFLLLVSCSCPAEETRTLRVVIDQDYPPFFYIDEKGGFVGASVDFWRLWEKKTGVPVELIPLPFEKTHEAMKAREAEVIDTIFWTPERELYLDFAGPLFPMTSSIYLRRGLHIASLSDLTPYVVGAKSRDALVDYARSENPSLQFRLFQNYSDIVAAAKRGEIDCFLMDDLPANYYLVKYDLLAHFSRVPLPILNHLYLATWKGNAEVLGILKEGLAKFSKEEIDGLLKPYVVELETHPPWLGSAIAVSAFGAAAFIGILFAFNRLLKRQVAQATKSLREAGQKLLKTVEVVASLPLFSVKEEAFLSRILDLALELIPKASSGSALLVDESGRGKIVAVRGHDEGLVGFTFEKEDLIVFDKVTVVQDILNPKRRFSSKERFERLVALSRPISETLVAPFLWKERFFGHLTLDILKRDKERFNKEDIALVEQFARICVAFHALREYAQKEESLFEGLLSALAKALEYYDGSTRVHSEVSAGYAFEIARSLGLSEENARLVRWAALVHDVGKIFIPQEILRKPARLTPEEHDLVKLHTTKGEELLLSIKGLEPVARIVRHHHERFDGTGYPDGLRGEEIPLEARILAVVDAFEAMTSDRPYRRAMSVDEALEELKRFSGTQFDPEVVRAMTAVVEEQIEYSRGRD